MAQIRVVVSGTGKMGRAILDAIPHDAELKLVGVIDKSSTEMVITDPATGEELPQALDPVALMSHCHPDVVVDFTNGVWTPFVARAALEARARPVIGTTDLSSEFIEELRTDCQRLRLGAFIAPNFAIGAVLMMHMARLAAPYFDAAEIIELHHDKKVDSPSGTAIATAEAMSASRQTPFAATVSEREPLPGARGARLEGVSLHSVRLPGLVAHQVVIFGGVGQTLTIRHDSTSRESFIPGILMATRRVMELDHLVIGLDKLLGLA